MFLAFVILLLFFIYCCILARGKSGRSASRYSSAGNGGNGGKGGDGGDGGKHFIYIISISKPLKGNGGNGGNGGTIAVELSQTDMDTLMILKNHPKYYGGICGIGGKGGKYNSSKYYFYNPFDFLLR